VAAEHRSTRIRLRNLKNERLRDVLAAAAKAFGWASRRKRAGVGFGIAGGFEKGSYLATCAEVRVEGPSRELKLVRLVSAYDCGSSVNPDQLKNQVEGAMVQGLGGALFEAVEFTNGVLDNGRFSKYRVPRFRDPQRWKWCCWIAHVLLGPVKHYRGVAPAIANAIYDAVGCGSVDAAGTTRDPGNHVYASQDQVRFDIFVRDRE
jgi:isoquinoline 1-oxidoreductase